MEDSQGLKDYSDNSPVFSRDPVCGMSVDESKAPAKSGYAGVTYYFCSHECQKKFEHDPGLYIGQRR